MTPAAMLLIMTGIVLYIVEYLWKIEYVAGIAAALFLTIGIACIESRSPKSPVVAAGVLLGLAMVWLCRTAKRARLNKTHDL
jgi:hypothetical protein